MLQMFSKPVLFTAVLATAVAGCKDDHKHGPETPGQPAAKGGDSHDDAVSIGEKTVGSLTVKASQAGKVKAGDERAFDVTITGYADGQKPRAIRLWVGIESAEGSVKARAEDEKPGTWHSHVDVPSPLPADAKFWVEVEPATGDKFTVSFDLLK